MTLLFVDTENDPVTKEPECIQMKYGDKVEIFEDFNNLEPFIKAWRECDAVIMFNAPYDLGMLSSIEPNTYVYKEQSEVKRWEMGNVWEMNICGFTYTVLKLGFARNLISSKNGPPVIDLQKLWNILVNDKPLSLKDLIKNELGEEAIPYSKENAKTREYREQDVIQLEKLWYVFLNKVNTIPVVQKYNYSDWGKIYTPASFVKAEYVKRYPDLRDWKNLNNKQNRKWGLESALEQAYNGGITCALLHGTRDNTAWYDIHGAYAHVIQNENMDQYKLYEWEYSEYTTEKPLLCYCLTDVVLGRLNNSLKIYRVKKPDKRYMWNYDIEAMECLFPDAHINVMRAYYPKPLNNVECSLPAEWSALKEKEEREHGKTTLREYYKFMSNTSYGITAQREPKPTIHTNMVIAGIITSRAHLILCQMVETARSYGCEWLYSDTDSICVDLHGCDPKVLEDALNKRIATYQPSKTIDPYSCGCEFIGTTKVLSLKRYHAYNGHDLKGWPVEDKIRTHGKGAYKITPEDICSMLAGNVNMEHLVLKEVCATTPRTLKRCLNLNSKITHPHPFMFETGIKTGRCKHDWFEGWNKHIDSKTTIPKNAKIYDEFMRDFHVFESNLNAEIYYKNKYKDTLDVFDLEFRDWDKEDELLFGEL